MEPLLENISIFNSKHYVKRVIESALKQFHNHSKPSNFQLSWKAPSPSDTDYKQADSSDVVSLQLSNVTDINWDMINWDLLSELDKDDIRNKQFLCSI